MLGEDCMDIIGQWCNNHRLDCVVDAGEHAVAFVALILAWLRGLCSHVWQSPKSKGILAHIASMVYSLVGDHGLDHVTSASLASLHYAPQRWLSHVAPLKSLCSRIGDIVLYLLDRKADKSKATRIWAADMYKLVADVRFWLVLPGLLDVLILHNKVNARLQPESADIWCASRNIAMLERELADLILRTKSGANGLQPAVLVRAAVEWFKQNGDYLKNLPKNATWFERTIAKLAVQEEEIRDERTGRVAEVKCFAVFVQKYKTKDGKAAQATLKMAVSAALIKESVAIVTAYAQSCLRDLHRRFRNADLAEAVATAFNLEFDAETCPEPTPAWTQVAIHFKSDYEEFRRSCLALHRYKQAEIVSIQRRSPEISRNELKAGDVWAVVLRTIDASGVEVGVARQPLMVLLFMGVSTANVERDGGVKKKMEEAMHGQGYTTTLDAKVRVCLEGPAYQQMKTECPPSTYWHPMLVEAPALFTAQQPRKLADRLEPACKRARRSDPSKEVSKLGAVRPKHDALHTMPVETHLEIRDGVEEICEVGEPVGQGACVNPRKDLTVESLFGDFEFLADDKPSLAPTKKVGKAADSKKGSKYARLAEQCKVGFEDGVGGEALEGGDGDVSEDIDVAAALGELESEGEE